MAHPFFPWMGGKRRLADRIIATFPDHTCYVEPFAGGAAVFFIKPPSKAEVLNDVDGEIVNLYRVVRHHLDEFARQFRWALVSREIFAWAQATPPETLTDIQRAARFYYLQKLCFGAKPTGRTFGTGSTSPPRLNLLRLEEDLSQAHLRLARVTIEHLDWEAVVAKYDRPATLFYLDPPYLGLEGYGRPFGAEEYVRLAETMRGIKGRAILSTNDSADVRRILRGFKREAVELAYTVGGGRKMARELIVRSW